MRQTWICESRNIQRTDFLITNPPNSSVLLVVVQHLDGISIVSGEVKSKDRCLVVVRDREAAPLFDYKGWQRRENFFGIFPKFFVDSSPGEVILDLEGDVNLHPLIVHRAPH